MPKSAPSASSQIRLALRLDGNNWNRIVHVPRDAPLFDAIA